MFVAYHVTRAENLSSIMSVGLTPSVGPRSRFIGEPRECVYLFTSFENMDNALWNWLGEIFEEEDEYEGREIERVALEVKLDDEFRIDPNEMYEIAYPHVIPPERISVMNDYAV